MRIKRSGRLTWKTFMCWLRTGHWRRIKVEDWKVYGYLRCLGCGRTLWENNSCE